MKRHEIRAFLRAKGIRPFNVDYIKLHQRSIMPLNAIGQSYLSLILSFNVLHDWDFSDVKLLLENSYRNLNPGGRIMIHDAHINAEKNGPLPVAEYSVLLMFASEGKCYSISEMEELLAGTGFSGIEYVPTIANRSVIIGEKKRKYARVCLYRHRYLKDSGQKMRGTVQLKGKYAKYVWVCYVDS